MLPNNQNLSKIPQDFIMEDNNEATNTSLQFNASNMERNNIVMLEPHKIWSDNTNNQCYANQNQFLFQNQFGETQTVPFTNKQQFCKCCNKLRNPICANYHNNSFHQFTSHWVLKKHNPRSVHPNTHFDMMDFDIIRENDEIAVHSLPLSHSMDSGCDELNQKGLSTTVLRNSSESPNTFDGNSILENEANTSRILPVFSFHHLYQFACAILYDWFIQHVNWPCLFSFSYFFSFQRYPNPKEKIRLAKICQQTSKQIDQWFANRRRRTPWKTEKEKSLKQLDFLRERAMSKTHNRICVSTDSPFSNQETTQSLDLLEESPNKSEHLIEQCHSLPELSGFDHFHSMNSEYLTPSASSMSVASENVLQNYVLPKPIQTFLPSNILSPPQMPFGFFSLSSAYNLSSSCPTSSYYQLEEKTQQIMNELCNYEKEEHTMGIEQKNESATGNENEYYGNPPIVREPTWFDGDTETESSKKIDLYYLLLHN